MSERPNAQVEDRGQGRCALSGELTLDSVPVLWKQLQTQGLLGSAREADLGDVVTADSAGLALLVTWKAECARVGGTLAFRGVPQRLVALARLTGAQGLLEGAA